MNGSLTHHNQHNNINMSQLRDTNNSNSFKPINIHNNKSEILSAHGKHEILNINHNNHQYNQFNYTNDVNMTTNGNHKKSINEQQPMDTTSIDNNHQSSSTLDFNTSQNLFKNFYNNSTTSSNNNINSSSSIICSNNNDNG